MTLVCALVYISLRLARRVRATSHEQDQHSARRDEHDILSHHGYLHGPPSTGFTARYVNSVFQFTFKSVHIATNFALNAVNPQE
jgi:hypothetical protein